MKLLLSIFLINIFLGCGSEPKVNEKEDVLKDSIVKFNSHKAIDEHCVRDSSDFKLAKKMFDEILYVTVSCEKDLPNLGNPRHVKLKYSYVLLLLI